MKYKRKSLKGGYTYNSTKSRTHRRRKSRLRRNRTHRRRTHRRRT